MSYRVRVWDLPIRIFHWMLAVCVSGLLITGTVGGNAMVWHLRFGYVVMSLLMFRMVWGVVGGRWARFSSFLYSPASVIAYLKGKTNSDHSVGHSPLAAVAVFLMLSVLAAQLVSGLFSDDEIAFAGPLIRYVSNSTVSLATGYHKNYGRWFVIALVVMHIAAVLTYLLKKKQDLVTPMVMGDKEMGMPTLASRDDLASRFAAALIFTACAGCVAWLVSLGQS